MKEYAETFNTPQFASLSPNDLDSVKVSEDIDG